MNKEEILEWLETYNRNNSKCKYTINDDMSIDVKGSVKLTKIPGNKITDGIKFNIVSGDFKCNDINLTTLDGSPKKVGGDFHSYSNDLTSLEGGPEEVGKDFYCSYNDLKSLAGAPKEVGGYFSCIHNKLPTLEGGPEKVGGSFDCYYNELTSLKGCPKEVKGDFDCSDNKLVNLKYMPIIKFGYNTDFTKEEVKIEQDIMKQAKTYKEGVETYQEYLDIFGDE